MDGNLNPGSFAQHIGYLILASNS